MNKVNFSFLKPLLLSVLNIFLLTNCEQSEKKNSRQYEQSENKKNIQDEQFEPELILESLFFYTINELQEKFGKSNVRNEFIEACETCGPEGTPTYENSYTTMLFPNTSKEVYIVWNSLQTKVTEVSVSLNGNEWKTKEGFRLGDSISKINYYFKNKPIKLTYANWFYYDINDYYTLMFSSDDLNFDNLDTENITSVDSRLKNLVLVAISLRLPGNE
jgi:hypothetical protein